MEINKMSRNELNQLQEKINKRKQKIHDDEIRERKKEAENFIDYLRENKDVILKILPDKEYNNTIKRDTTDKSILEDILNNEWDNNYDIRFEVYIDFIK